MMKKLLFLVFLAAPAMAQVQLGGHIVVPSTSDSSLGASNVAMTDANCNIVTPSGCTVSNGPYVKTLNVTGTLTAGRSLTVVLSPGREYVITNGTAQSLTVGGASGTSVAVAAGGTVSINSPDGANYKAAGGGNGLTLQTNGINNPSQTALNLVAGTNIFLSNSGTSVTINGGGASVPSANLLALYDTYNGSGSTLPDLSGHNNSAPLCTGSYGTTPAWVTGGYGLKFNPGLLTDCVGPLPTTLTAVQGLVMSVYITPMGTAVAPGVNNGVGFSSLLTYNVLPFNGYTYSGTVGLIATSTTSPATQMYTPNSFSISKPPESPYAGYQVIGVDFGHWNGTSCDSYDVYYINGVAIPGTYVQQGCSGNLAGTVGGITGNFFIGPAPAGPQGSGSGSTPWQATGYVFPGTLYTMAIYSQPLGATGQAVAAAAIQAKNNSGSAQTAPPPTNITKPNNYCIGDSITYGYPSFTPYCQLLALNSTPFSGTVLNAISGISTAADIASEVYRTGPNCATPTGPSYASVFSGTNDFLFFAGDTGQTVYSKLAQEAQILHSKGCRVFIASMLSRGNASPPSATSCSSVFDNCKNALNALLPDGVVNGVFDGFVDFAAFPGFGANGAYANPTNICQSAVTTTPAVGGSLACFQSDQTHPTQAGQNTLASIYSNVYNRIFGSTKLNPHVISSSAAYQMLPSDGGISYTGASSATFTLPDCTGLTGETFSIASLVDWNVTVLGLIAAQPVNGSSGAVVPTNGSLTLTVVANPYAMSGCHWVY